MTSCSRSTWRLLVEEEIGNFSKQSPKRNQTQKLGELLFMGINLLNVAVEGQKMVPGYQSEKQMVCPLPSLFKDEMEHQNGAPKEYL